MGDVFWGLHAPLAASLIRAQRITYAIETGTYFGFGALQLAALAEHVTTIEHDRGLFDFCVDMYGGVPNIEFLHGQSGDLLPDVLNGLSEPTLFVLDAHWFPMSARASDRPTDLCPVLSELKAIEALEPSVRAASALIIDDAQMFLGSLKVPFVRSALPSIVDILEVVHTLYEETRVTDDIIIGCSARAASRVDRYLSWRDSLQFP